MSADLVADTRRRIAMARRRPDGGEAIDARGWIDAAERLADELERVTAQRCDCEVES